MGEKQMSRVDYYRHGMEDLDPNYDDSNAEMYSYENEADTWEDEMAEGVHIENIHMCGDPLCKIPVNMYDCYYIKRVSGNM